MVTSDLGDHGVRGGGSKSWLPRRLGAAPGYFFFYRHCCFVLCLFFYFFFCGLPCCSPLDSATVCEVAQALCKKLIPGGTARIA